MCDFEYVYIIDYSCSEIYEVKLNEYTNDLDTEKLLIYYNLNPDECYVMYSQRKIKIKPLTK